MTRRQVLIPLASYRDLEGRVRHALQNEQVDVGDEWLEDFDKLNGSTPKQRGPATTEPSPTSRRSTAKAEAKAAGRAPTPKKH